MPAVLAVLATLLFVALVAGVATAGYRTVTKRPSAIAVNVVVNGAPQSVELQDGDGVADALAVAGVAPHDGRLLSAKDRHVLDPRSDPARITVGGRVAAQSATAVDGDVIQVIDGKDTTEATKQLDVVIPPPPMPPVLRHVQERGVPGLKRATVGVRSGDVVSEQVITPAIAPKQTTQRVVAFTFDDGPSAAWTPAVLQVLADKGVHATFCEVGRQVRATPEMSRRVLAAGHQLCNHTVDHDENLDKANQARLDAQIGGGAKVFADKGLAPPAYYRPPGGTLSDAITATARDNDEQTLYWKVDTKDWQKGATPLTILGHVLAEVDDGAIILMHDGGGPNRFATVAALGQAIDILRGQGYTFVAPMIDPTTNAPAPVPAPLPSVPVPAPATPAPVTTPVAPVSPASATVPVVAAPAVTTPISELTGP